MEQSVIDNVIESNNIIDVIGSYFPLKKTGSNFKSRCPFHDEKTASFVVSEKKQIYKCFGCGKAGNVISFVRDYEKVSFIDAIKKLASRVGISINETKVNKAKQSRRELIYTIYTLAAAHFQENLGRFGDFAKQYLLKRNISEETIKKFQIGYALDSFNGLKNYLVKNSINTDILDKTGLFGTSAKGTYDGFRDRLMFPIHSVNGKIVAFGGRILHEEQKGGKYINSPTTEIYTKGNELYGLHITRYEIGKKNFALICEGYTDFLRLYENGFTNSAASLGTSLTDNQINVLSRYTNNIYLLYDGDKAGQKAALRAALNVLKKGFQTRIITLPETEDPDSYLVKYGNENLESKISEAKSVTQFLKENKTLGLDTKSKLEMFTEALNEMQDQISMELLIKDISETFKISQNAITSKLRKGRKKEEIQVEKIDFSGFPEERNLLKLILDGYVNIKNVAEEVNSDYFLNKIYKSIFKIISKNIEEVGQVSAMTEFFEDEIERNVFGEIFIEDSQEIPYEEIIKCIKKRKFETDLKNINDKIRVDSKNTDLYRQKDRILKEISKFKTISNKKVRKAFYQGE
jgi:DNA primase